jgi:hypothetical protein
MTITMLDGSQRTFLLSPRKEERLTLAKRLETLLSLNSIGICVQDRLLIIPTAQIQSLEFSPFSGLHPETLIGPAREI